MSEELYLRDAVSEDGLPNASMGIVGRIIDGKNVGCLRDSDTSTSDAKIEATTTEETYEIVLENNSEIPEVLVLQHEYLNSPEYLKSIKGLGIESTGWVIPGHNIDIPEDLKEINLKLADIRTELHDGYYTLEFDKEGVELAKAIQYVKDLDMLSYFTPGTKYSYGMLLYLTGLYNLYYDLLLDLRIINDSTAVEYWPHKAMYEKLGFNELIKKQDGDTITTTLDTGAREFLEDSTKKGNLFDPISDQFNAKVYTLGQYIDHQKSKYGSVHKEWLDLASEVSDRPGVENEYLTGQIVFPPNTHPGDDTEERSIKDFMKHLANITGFYRGKKVLGFTTDRFTWNKMSGLLNEHITITYGEEPIPDTKFIGAIQKITLYGYPVGVVPSFTREYKVWGKDVRVAEHKNTVFVKLEKGDY